MNPASTQKTAAMMSLADMLRTEHMMSPASMTMLQRAAVMMRKKRHRKMMSKSVRS